MPKMYQNLDLNYLKTVYKMLRLEIFLTFDNTFAANILGMWEKRRGLPPPPPHVGVFLPSELVSQHSCKKLPKKLVIMIEHIKMM